MTKQEFLVYGMSVEDIREEYANSFTSKAAGIEMTVMGILSDAQEVMARGNTENARKLMNVAKFLLADMLEEKLKAA